MFLGYNTNGFAHHRLSDALDILRECGYEGVALTPDVHHFDPARDNWAELTEQLVGLRVVIETGARFLLDPRRKHQPTLLSPDPSERAIRAEFLRTCVRLASHLRADAVSFWSGVSISGEADEVLFDRLVTECQDLSKFAGDVGVVLAFEPEPGMFIDRTEKFYPLAETVAHPAFGLTLDIGHVICEREGPISDIIQRAGPWLKNVHIEDMNPGVHDHLMFGEGTVDFPATFEALKCIGYQGGVYVELSRHSHDAVRTARASRDFLRRWCTVKE
ncbi:MAG: sugar phosphate isomerase/epimerase family protein [Fimbriiglobus sp.]